MSDNAIAIPDTRPLDNKAVALVESARTIVVNDSESYKRAGTFLTEIVKPLRKEIESAFAEQKSLAFKTHRAVTAAEKKHLQPVLDAEAIVKEKMGAFNGKAEGITTIEKWSGEVVDFDALFDAAAKDRNLRKYFFISESEINKTADSSSGMANLPGVKFVKRTIVRAKAVVEEIF